MDYFIQILVVKLDRPLLWNGASLEGGDRGNNVGTRVSQEHFLNLQLC